MLATPDMGSSMALLGELGLLAALLGILACLGGRWLLKAGLRPDDSQPRQAVVAWIGWGAAVLALGAAMAVVGLVLLVLMAYVLAQ